MTEQMQMLHQKWREKDPAYPMQTTASKTFFFNNDHVCNLDVTVHDGWYYFVMGMTPLTASYSMTRWKAFSDDILEAVIDEYVKERKQSFLTFLSLFHKHMPDEAKRNCFMEENNLLKLSNMLRIASADIRSDYHYKYAPDDVIGEHFVKYVSIVKLPTSEGFSSLFRFDTKDEKWIVPELVFDTGDESL
jgi:hypothetical protein